MNNKYLILRHAETIKDPNLHAKDWSLTPDALVKVNDYIQEGKFLGVTKIFASTEPKAVATGKPIANSLNLPIGEMEEFVEIKREKKFLTEEEFLDQKTRELTKLDSIENGAESGLQALQRFESGIEKLESEFTNETILIVTHGTIMTLFLAKRENALDNAFSLWKNIKFCELVTL